MINIKLSAWLKAESFADKKRSVQQQHKSLSWADGDTNIVLFV